MLRRFWYIIPAFVLVVVAAVSLVGCHSSAWELCNDYKPAPNWTISVAYFMPNQDGTPSIYAVCHATLGSTTRCYTLENKNHTGSYYTCP